MVNFRLLIVIFILPEFACTQSFKDDFFIGTACQVSAFSSAEDSLFHNRIVREYFNVVTVSNMLKWNNWEKQNKRFGKDKLTFALDWLQSNNKTIKGHFIILGPLKREENYSKYGRQNYFDKLVEHSIEKVNLTKSHIDIWDFVNHPVGANYFDERYDIKKLKFLADTLVAIHPDIQLMINEGGIIQSNNPEKREKYYQRIKTYLENGIPLKGIGFMGHFHDKRGADYEYIKETFDLFSEFGLPLIVTEFDYRFGEQSEHMSLDSTQLQRQAEVTDKLLNLFYEHPAVSGVILWGFWSKYHWYPTAAFWDDDRRLKPNGEVLLRFIDEKGLK